MFRKPLKKEQTYSELEEAILDSIQQAPTITRHKIATQLRLSSETIKEYLETLKNAGRCEACGRKEGGVLGGGGVKDGNVGFSELTNNE